MTLSHWQRPHSFTSPELSTDVLVLGGGFVGLSTAYWITELCPGVKVTVLERRQCGEGASGRNAGFLTIGSASFYKTLVKTWGEERAAAINCFAQTSLELLHHQILKASPEIKFEKTFSSTLLKKNVARQNWEDGFSCSNFGFEWKENLGLENFSGGYEYPAEYKINPMQLLASLKKLLESRKVQIVENVSGFELTPDGCKTELHLIRAKQVVLALNGYASEFHHSFKNIFFPRRAQMLAVEVETSLETPGLYYDPEDRVYWRKASDKVLLIGGKRLLDADNEVGVFDKISPVIQDGLEKYLTQELSLKYKVIHRWSGIMGFTKSELPFIQKINAPLETFVVGGFSGHGMGFGFHSAKEVAELVSGQKSESFFNQFNKEIINL